MLTTRMGQGRGGRPVSSIGVTGIFAASKWCSLGGDEAGHHRPAAVIAGGRKTGQIWRNRLAKAQNQVPAGPGDHPGNRPEPRVDRR